MTKPQQANGHLFTAPVNNLPVLPETPAEQIASSHIPVPQHTSVSNTQAGTSTEIPHSYYYPEVTAASLNFPVLPQTPAAKITHSHAERRVPKTPSVSNSQAATSTEKPNPRKRPFNSLQTKEICPYTADLASVRKRMAIATATNKPVSILSQKIDQHEWAYLNSKTNSQ